MTNPSGATFSVDSFPYGGTAVNATAVPDAQMNVDVNLVAQPAPGRLKVWDGEQWVPVRPYVFDSVTQGWVPVS